MRPEKAYTGIAQAGARCRGAAVEGRHFVKRWADFASWPGEAVRTSTDGTNVEISRYDSCEAAGWRLAARRTDIELLARVLQAMA
jgi:hypothetical protein